MGVIRDRKLTGLVPELRRGNPAETIPVLAKLDDSTAVDLLLSFLGNPRWAETARSALRSIDPVLLATRAQALLYESRRIKPLIAGLVGLNRKSLGPFFMRALRISEVRGTALEELGRLQYKEAVPAILPFLAAERIGDRARKALLAITGRDFGRDRGRWERWWKENS